jgi:hypothetical protein
VFLFHNLLGKDDAALAGFHFDELKKLLAGEISGMRSHKVEETGLLFRIAEIAELFRKLSCELVQKLNPLRLGP